MAEGYASMIHYAPQSHIFGIISSESTCRRYRLVVALSTERSRYLTADRLVPKLTWANKCMHQSSLIKLTVHTENLHLVTELNFNLYRYSKFPQSHYLGYRS